MGAMESRIEQKKANIFLLSSNTHEKTNASHGDLFHAKHSFRANRTVYKAEENIKLVQVWVAVKAEFKELRGL